MSLLQNLRVISRTKFWDFLASLTLVIKHDMNEHNNIGSSHSHENSDDKLTKNHYDYRNCTEVHEFAFNIYGVTTIET